MKTFVLTPAWKNSINTTIGGVRMFPSSCAFKSLNSIEKILPRIMYTTSNGNPCTMIVSCYSHTSASGETDITILNDKLFPFAQHIHKHNILIISGDINAQIHKDENNKFGLHHLPIRNDEYLTDFSLKKSFMAKH